jgi:acyl carrier protein
VPEDRVMPGASFDELGADSLARVELTLVFEEAFDIDIPDDEAGEIRTVRDAIVAVERNLPLADRGERGKRRLPPTSRPARA